MSRPKDSRVRAPSFVDGPNRGGSSAAQSGMMRVTSKSVVCMYMYVRVRSVSVCIYEARCHVHDM